MPFLAKKDMVNYLCIFYLLDGYALHFVTSAITFFIANLQNCRSVLYRSFRKITDFL